MRLYDVDAVLSTRAGAPEGAWGPPAGEAGRPPDGRGAAFWAVAAVLVGFGVRLAWCLVAVRPHIGSHDPAYYLRYAEHIAAGRGYTTDAGRPTAYYPVGYPGLLGGVRWVLVHTPLPDSEPWMAAAVNLVFGTATIGLVAVVGRRVIGRWAGAVAAWIVALQPNLIYNSAPALTETVFLGLLVAALAVLLWRPLTEPASVVRLSGAGVLLGLAGLVRPVALVLLPGLALVLCWQWRRRIARPARTWAIVTISCLVALAPWVVRNAVVMHRATLATNTGDNLCIGNNPTASGAFMLPGWCFDDFPAITDETVEVRRDRVLSTRGLRWAAHHPVDEARLVFWRTYWTFLSSHDGLRAVQSYERDPWLTTYHTRIESVLATAGDAYWFVTAALGALGLVLWRRRPDARRSVLAMTVLGLTIVVWPFFGDTRFGLPVVALVAFPAASALEAVFGGRRREGRLDIVSDVAVVAVVGVGPVVVAAVAGPVVVADVADDGHDSEQQAEEHGAVGGVEGERPAETGSRAGDHLASGDVPPGDEHEQRPGGAHG